MKSRKLVPNIQLVLAAIIWGSSFYIQKDMYEYISPVLLIAVRYFLAAIILGSILLLKKEDLKSNFAKSIPLGLALFFMAIPQAIGLEMTSSANSAFITGLFVFSAPFFSYLILKKKPSPQTWIAVAVALVGLWVLTGGVNNVNSGDTITLITPLAIGLHIVLSERLIDKCINMFISLFQQLLIMSSVSFLVAFLVERPIKMEVSEIVLPMFYLAIFPTIIALILQFFAQKKISSTNVAIVESLEPVFAAIFAWTLGGETFVMTTAVGGIIIFASMIFSELPLSKK